MNQFIVTLYSLNLKKYIFEPKQSHRAAINFVSEFQPKPKFNGLWPYNCKSN